MQYKIIKPKYFYIAFFVLNFLSAFALQRGWFNPNISAYTSFKAVLLASISDLMFLGLIYFIVVSTVKTHKVRIRILTIVSAVLMIFVLFLQCFSNMFSTFFSYTQLVSFKNPSQGKLIMGYISYFLRMFLRMNGLFPILMFLIIFIGHFFVNTYDYLTHKFRFSILSIFGSILSLIIITIIGSSNLNKTSNEVSMNGIYGTSHMGTFNYYLYSIKDLWDKPALNEKKENEINQFLDNHLYNDNNILTHQGKNLIILQLEAINNFVIDLKLNDELIAPNLSKLSSEGYYNSRFYSAAGMGNTSDCEFSSIVGLYPNGNDLSVFDLEGEHYPTLPKEFNKLGYETFSIHGNEGGFYNRNFIHEDIFGFNNHIDMLDLLDRNPELSYIKDWISDDALLNESINIYKEQTKPFFSYNILVSSHSPYTISDGVKKYSNNNLTGLSENYISYVMYVDNVVGDFINNLKNEGLYDNSIIVIYGDHTSSLLKDDTESITNKNYSDIEFRLEMQNVPFIILGNDIPIIKDNSVHSNVDIFPTMSYLFNLSPKYKFGVNMMSDETSYVYNVRSLDIIFNDYVILYPSKDVYYTNKNIGKISKDKFTEIINDFTYYKYVNDLTVRTNYLGKNEK